MIAQQGSSYLVVFFCWLGQKMYFSYPLFYAPLYQMNPIFFFPVFLIKTNLLRTQVKGILGKERTEETSSKAPR